MNITKVLLAVLLSGYTYATSQTTIDCNNFIDLCNTDVNVRLPDNNQTILGQEDPNATACSAHITFTLDVQSDLDTLIYQVDLFEFGAGSAIPILSASTIHSTNGSFTLSSATEDSPDTEISTSGISYTGGPGHILRWTITKLNHGFSLI